MSTELAIDRLLSPLTTKEFMAECWLHNFRFGRRESEGYEDLFSWSVLNRLLTQHRFVSPRLRLFRKSTRIPPAMYQDSDPPHRLKTKPFLQCLDQGATVILDGVEEAHPPLLEIVAQLQYELKAPVSVNTFAAWGSEEGLSRHFDSQENIICQISGKKHWSVWQPTRISPLNIDPQAAPDPDGVPTWEGIMEPGSWLYIPRGWWHIAHPLNEPTLHLTITIRTYTGLDFIVWLSQRCIGNPLFRSVIPLHNDPALEAYVRTLCSEMTSIINQGMLKVFWEEKSAEEFIYPHLSLPDLSVKTISNV